MANLYFNRVIIAGKLCAEPELRNTQSGTPVVSFRVAVNRKPSNNEQKADFFNVSAWSETATFISKYFHKGSSIFFEGRIQERQWTDKEGQKRYATEIIAERVYFVDSKNEVAPLPDNNVQPAPTTQPNTAHGNFEDITQEDDLPF